MTNRYDLEKVYEKMGFGASVHLVLSANKENQLHTSNKTQEGGDQP